MSLHLGNTKDFVEQIASKCLPYGGQSKTTWLESHTNRHMVAMGDLEAYREVLVSPTTLLRLKDIVGSRHYME